MAVADWTEDEEIKQSNRLRRDVGADDGNLTNELALEYFEEAEEKYPSDTSKMLAYARVIALKGIRASSAMLGKYAQNQSSEDLTKVFDNLGEMLEDALADLEKAADPLAEDDGGYSLFGVATGRRGL